MSVGRLAEHAFSGNNEQSECATPIMSMVSDIAIVRVLR